MGKSLRKPDISAFTLAIPWRPLIGRLGVGLLLTLSFSLVILSKTDSALVRTIQTSATTVLVPVLNTVMRPLDAASDAGGWVGEMLSLRSDNLRLAAENAELQRWQLIAREMQAENDALRKLSNFTGGHRVDYTSARVVTDAAGPYMRSALINSGTAEGIARYEAVVSERGLVGRIVEAGPNSARVLLINDINSRIPVIAETSREKAVLAGNNTELPLLNYLPDDTKIEVGERIITAGDGKLLPPGIPVGVVKSIDHGTVKIQPLVDWSRLEYVSVAHFEF